MGAGVDGSSASVDGSNGQAADAAGGAPKARGPSMVPVGGTGFSIDSTEVSNADYAAFLAADPQPDLPAVCEGKTGFDPTNGNPFYATGQDDLPVVNVDWCDAYAYCAWAGKRLCGRIAGGTNPPANGNDATQSQWYSACSAGGTLLYPYGAAYVAGICNGNQPMGSPLVAVGSDTGCVGGYPGIYDMSGNAWEWEDSCNAETGMNDECQIRGGRLFSAPAALTCTTGTPATRGSTMGDRGFRCCSN